MNRRDFFKTTTAGIVIAAAPAIVDSKQVYRGSTKVWVPELGFFYGDNIAIDDEHRIMGVLGHVSMNPGGFVEGQLVHTFEAEYKPGDYSVRFNIGIPVSCPCIEVLAVNKRDGSRFRYWSQRSAFN